MKNYYKVLGIPPNASTDEVDKAYQVLSHQYDPAKNSGDKYAEERFIDIAIAYKTLSDNEKRNDYDKILAEIQPGADVPKKQQKNSAEQASNKSWLPFVLIGGLATIIIAFFIIRNNKQDATDVATTTPVDIPALQSPANIVQDTEATVATVTDTVAKGLQKEQPENILAEEPHKKEKPEAKKTTAKIKKDSITKQPEPAENVPDGLYIGAGKKHVLNKQGTPTSIIKYENNSEMWYYGKSTIYFAGNKVSAYRNIDNNLKIADSGN